MEEQEEVKQEEKLFAIAEREKMQKQLLSDQDSNFDDKKKEILQLSEDEYPDGEDFEEEKDKTPGGVFKLS